jgi:AcrR family transcriptional regulator
MSQARRSGRPRLQQSVPRESILATAARLFHEKGYQATTVRDIAAAVGIRPGSLFHHFASKEQLLVEMLREASISLCVGAEAAVASETGPDRQLAALVRYELTCLVGDRTRYRFAVLISEWRDVPPSARPEIKMLGQRYYAVWEAVLERCAASGLLRLDPFATLKVLHGVDRGATLWFRQQTHYTVPEFSRLLTNLVLTRDLRGGT